MLAVRGLFLFVAFIDLVKTQHIPVIGVQTGFRKGDIPPVRRNINQLESEGGPAWYVAQ